MGETFDPKNKNEKDKIRERLEEIFKGVNAGPLINSILKGEFELKSDIEEEEREEGVNIGFSFKYKSGGDYDMVDSYLNSVNSAIYREIQENPYIHSSLKETFGLIIDRDKGVISPAFFVKKKSPRFEELKAEAILALKDIKKILGIKEGK